MNSEFEEIIVEVDEDGNVTIEGNGFEGNSCIEGMEWLTKALPVGKVTNKPEFYESDHCGTTRTIQRE